MNPIYETLFETYGASVLQALDGQYDDEAILEQLEQLVPDKKARLRLEDLFFDFYNRWSVDAFALGLHLGLSLLHDNVRRVRPQQAD